MDYQYTVEEQDMKFDVEIREEDDFDIWYLSGDANNYFLMYKW